MNKQDFKDRTKEFALGILTLVDGLPKKLAANIIARQLVRSGTSVGANYRAACRARSKADFISKMGIVEEEADEAMFWMELLRDSRLLEEHSLHKSYQQANAIVAMTIASIKTARN